MRKWLLEFIGTLAVSWGLSHYSAPAAFPYIILTALLFLSAEGLREGLNKERGKKITKAIILKIGAPMSLVLAGCIGAIFGLLYWGILQAAVLPTLAVDQEPAIQARVVPVSGNSVYFNVYLTNNGPDDDFSIQATIVHRRPDKNIRVGEPFTLAWLTSQSRENLVRRGDTQVARFGSAEDNSDGTMTISCDTFVPQGPALPLPHLLPVVNFSSDIVDIGGPGVIEWDIDFRTFSKNIKNIKPTKYKLTLNLASVAFRFDQY
jgi:hypothetical protein